MTISTQLKVYSPSQTIAFSECPMKRQLAYREHWQLRVAGKPRVAAWMGTAMAEGIAAYHGKAVGVPWERASICWERQVGEFRSYGGTIEDTNLDRMPGLLKRGIKYYEENDPIPPVWKVVGVEYPFPDMGYARPDLIVGDDEGYAPVDHKWKEKLYVKDKAGETKEMARTRTLAEYEHDWKMLHYVWAIREHFKVPCTHYYIILGELSPKPYVTIQRFEVDEGVYQRWTASAAEHWLNMVLYDNTDPPMAATHENKFGKCEFYDACFNLGLDRERMKVKYIQMKGRA